MTSIPIEREIGFGDFPLRLRSGLKVRRRRLVSTVRQASVVALVFGLGASLHVMKRTGLLVL